MTIILEKEEITGVIYRENKLYLRVYENTNSSDFLVVNGKIYQDLMHHKNLPKNLKFDNMIPYIDLDYYNEFQTLYTPKGWYWCEFYGGSKQYRCFLIPSTLKRADFFKYSFFRQLLDGSIDPIYQHHNIIVRQDPTHAMPGFYIVAPNAGYASTDQLDFELYMNMRLIDYRMGNMIREVFGVKNLYRVNEERKVSYQNVHTWLLPIDDLGNDKSIEEWNTLEYMIRYSSWRDYKDDIITFNKKMKNLVKTYNLEESAEIWVNCLKNYQKIIQKENKEIIKPFINIPPKDKNDAYTVYEYENIRIRHVPHTNLVGYYVIEEKYNSVDSETSYLRMRFLDYHLRIAMRSVLDIEYVYKLQEDKVKQCSSIFLLPIVDINTYDRIYHFTIAEYKKTFHNQKEDKKKIQQANEKIQCYLNSINLKEKDSLLIEAISRFNNLEKLNNIKQNPLYKRM